MRMPVVAPFLRAAFSAWRRSICALRSSSDMFVPNVMRSTLLGSCPKGNNLVVGIMPNVRASQPWNAGPLAPVTGNLFFVHSEIGFVRSDAAAATQHDTRDAPDVSVTCNVKQRPINPVHCLTHLFQHKHMSIEVRLQRRTEQLAKHCHVECRSHFHTADRGLQRLWRSIDQPGERSSNRRVPPIAEDVLRDGTMRHGLEPSSVQGSEQHTGITVT